MFNFSFTDGNGAKFYKSGNTLYITQTGDISESAVYKAARNLPSASDSTYRIWYMSGSSYQTTVSLDTASAGSLNAYFKLKAAPRPGSIRLTKTTEDGKNLSGWKFGIYSDAACTKLVSGPHTTDNGGKISAAGLSAGTYYVKELGHTDSAIGEMYYCSGANPQKVTVTAGAAATVSFTNKRNTGGVKIIKTMPDGGSTAGWKFEVYDSDNELVGVFTTGEDGTVFTDHLLPGTYTVKEIIPENSPYTCDAPNPKTVTISAGQTAEVTFTNRMKPGEIRIQKCTFNMNSELLGMNGTLIRDGVEVTHYKNKPEDIRYIYDGHEVVAHSLPHPFLPDLPDDEIIRQVEQDRLNLSELVGYEVCGFAYPCSSPKNDLRTIEIVRQKTGVRYARTVETTMSFAPQKDLYFVQGSIYHHAQWDNLFEMGERFLAAEEGEFYIWGHSYEFDIFPERWGIFEEFCKMMSNKPDIFYGTNREVFLSNEYQTIK